MTFCLQTFWVLVNLRHISLNYGLNPVISVCKLNVGVVKKKKKNLATVSEMKQSKIQNQICKESRAFLEALTCCTCGI